MDQLGTYCHQSRHRRILQHRLANSRVTSTMKQIPTLWAIYAATLTFYRPRWMNSPAEEPKYSNPPFHSLRNSRHPPSQTRARHLVTKEGYHAVEECPVHHLRPRCISIRWQVSIVAEVDPHRTLVNNRAVRADAPTGRRFCRTLAATNQLNGNAN